MQRLCSKLRTLSQISINTTLRASHFSPSFNPTNFQHSSPFSVISSQIRSHITASSSIPAGNGSTVSPLGFHSGRADRRQLWGKFNIVVVLCCVLLWLTMVSKKSKRRLRKPEIVPAAYAKVMKKMNFCAHY
ncbi:hypothetical protein KSS87_021425 [Heliosperma pusillum]|nr:hypothetical protein KSS87_021425 [Heliosperma pusillum]